MFSPPFDFFFLNVLFVEFFLDMSVVVCISFIVFLH